MTLKKKVFGYFLPAVLTFSVLVYLASIPAIQKSYYPAFEQFTLMAVSNSQPDIYFKTKTGTTQTPENPNQVVLLFNSKAYLKELLKEAISTGKRGSYDYKGFVIYITDFFTTPLIFFCCLLIFTPGTWSRKLISLLIGSLIILGFAYLTVQFRGLYMVAQSNVIDMHEKDVEWYQLLTYAFSDVATITVALLTWVLLAFQKFIKRPNIPKKSG